MRVGVDVGGTFTDLIAAHADGTIDIRKVASTPREPSQGLFRVIDSLGAGPIDALVHGTTVATNALLERRARHDRRLRRPSLAPPPGPARAVRSRP